MEKASAAKLMGALVLLGMAGVLFFRFASGRARSDELAYFYDLSERKLFVAPRTSIPPIRGINDAEEDGVRAVVISTNGNVKDQKARRIAYLEKYSPALKRQFQNMQSAEHRPETPGSAIGRGAAQAHIFVRRLDDPLWHAANSAEAEKIMTEWQSPGPDGKTPVVCAP